MAKVLVLCEYASLNGGERSLLTVLQHGLADHARIQVACPRHGPLAETLVRSGIAHRPLDLQAPHGARLPLADCRSRLRRLIDAVQPDLVHANSLAMSRLVGPVIAERSLPGLGHLRDILRINRRVVDDLNRHARLIAVSQATEQWYVDLGVDPQRLHVVHNGVDLKRFCPRPATGYLHRLWNLPPATMLIGTIGQIGMRKGLDVLLDAAAEVVQREPAVCFVIVGQRYSQKAEALEYETRLHERASHPDLQGRVRFLGLRDDIAELMNELTLLVHPARQEPLGRVLLEAAASGVPIVATCVGGTPEILAHDRSARLVPPDDGQALADAMLGLLADPASRQRLAQSARQQAATRFDANTAARALADQYQMVLRC
ncbi:MAG: glycosyltransferase family 1 protein [Planctomycetaceae bacterium]|nr:MAG: glycosyltransferase family 1 protein [Planctomycetaceae bacterium]